MPAQGIAVTVFSQSLGRTTAFYTGGGGEYFVPNIPPGTYTLEIWVRPGQPMVYQIQVVEPNTDVAPITVP